ncbi:MAG: hypothetical protein QXJ68_06900 [Methanocellales archaeon]
MKIKKHAIDTAKDGIAIKIDKVDSERKIFEYGLMEINRFI